MRLPERQCAPRPLSDADRYRWIRGNRGNFDILDALKEADRDADFDARIDAVIQRSLAGRRHACGLDTLATQSASGPYVFAREASVDDPA
ncbi:hypothetical protein [Aquabacterium sp.]|uniref:hypothetical protein n=1 Tax=Aquabacterium sp. TaxID=1872578 RepID=UPI002C68CF73|nr:hypothetical protein [Aquabacterium sp.]HSW06914.1 hypothetical protein [Aquabacterium sp.]